jgi:uncharacterized protein (TIGR00251 family)
MRDYSPIVVLRPNEIRFWLNVKPRRAQEHFALDSRGELELRVRAGASDGKANEACIDYLAGLLRISRSSIEILMGDKSRKKLIRIRGGEEIARKLLSEAGPALNQVDNQ